MHAPFSSLVYLDTKLRTKGEFNSMTKEKKIFSNFIITLLYRFIGYTLSIIVVLGYQNTKSDYFLKRILYSTFKTISHILVVNTIMLSRYTKFYTWF